MSSSLATILVSDPEELKRCVRCKEEKPLREFGTAAHKRDGLNIHCKSCVRVKTNARRAAWRATGRKRPTTAKPRADISANAITRRMKKLEPADRVREAIRLNKHTQDAIVSATNLDKSEVSEILARLLLWTRELRTEMYGDERMYFLKAVEAQFASRRPGRPAKPQLPADGSIDAGLFVLSVITPYGQEWTREEIAFVCGCTRERIRQIEVNALRQLQHRFQLSRRLSNVA